MKKYVILLAVLLSYSATAEANPFFKNKKHAVDPKVTRGTRIFYKAEPVFIPMYVSTNIRVEDHRKPNSRILKIKKKAKGPKAKNLGPAGNKRQEPGESRSLFGKRE